MVGSVLATSLETLAVNLTRAASMSLLGVLLSLAIWRVSAAPQRPLSRITLLGLGVAAATAMHSALDLQAHVLLRTAFHDEVIYRRIVSDSPLRTAVMGLIADTHVVIYAALYAFFGMAATTLRSAAEAREREALLAAARTEAVSAQLSMLRHQLNPHFVFNTLNAIGSLVAIGRNAAAEEMIDRLSGFLRASLGADAEPFTTLDDELTTLQAYLDIEAVRFGDRLRVTYDHPSELGAALVPSFLLQPLVENAIKHGVSPAMRPVEVRLTARREGGDLVVAVEDSGAGPDTDPTAPRYGTGAGLRNVRERLALLYGARARLEAAAQGEGFTARVRLPLEWSRAAAA
jgi:LytS/YehU family sensor histidine kinase